jgi:phospholipase/carboxylesterase
MMQAYDQTGNAPQLRDIFQYVAWNPAAGPARQMVVLLHGIGTRGDIMLKQAQEVAAVLPHARIVAPHGPEPYAPPLRREGDLLRAPDMIGVGPVEDPRQWFGIGGSLGDIREKLQGVAQKINEFIDNQRDITGVADKDIAIIGFSQGGGTALYTAFLRAQEIGAVVGHSTIFYAEPQMNSRPPTLFLYGDADRQFTQKAYQDAAAQVMSHVPDAEIRVVEELDHCTSRESRKIAAAFIRNHLAPLPPTA